MECWNNIFISSIVDVRHSERKRGRHAWAAVHKYTFIQLARLAFHRTPRSGKRQQFHWLLCIKSAVDVNWIWMICLFNVVDKERPQTSFHCPVCGRCRSSYMYYVLVLAYIFDIRAWLIHYTLLLMRWKFALNTHVHQPTHTCTPVMTQAASTFIQNDVK